MHSGSLRFSYSFRAHLALYIESETDSRSLQPPFPIFSIHLLAALHPINVLPTSRILSYSEGGQASPILPRSLPRRSRLKCINGIEYISIQTNHIRARISNVHTNESDFHTYAHTSSSWCNQRILRQIRWSVSMKFYDYERKWIVHHFRGWIVWLRNFRVCVLVVSDGNKSRDLSKFFFVCLWLIFVFRKKYKMYNILYTKPKLSQNPNQK